MSKKISKIQFGVMSCEDILKLSVVEITKSKFPGANSLYDPRMGPSSLGDSCITCNSDIKDCSGHFGHIKFNEPIVHPLYTKNVLKFLCCFCLHCSRLLITEFDISLWKIKNNRKKFDNIVEKCVKLLFCVHCKSIQPKFSFSTIENMYFVEYTKGERINFNIREIQKVFRNITDSDIRILGFNPEHIKPMNFILSIFPVLPPRARPFIKTENIIFDDDLTTQLCEIIKINNNLEDANLSDMKRQKYVQNLIFRVKTYMDNSQCKAKHTNMRPIKGIKERICGKDGIVRSNLMGKRCNFSARTVIGPDPTLCVNEIAVPPMIADILTYPVHVNERNIQEMYHLINTNQANVLIRNGVNIHLKYALQGERRNNFRLYVGDIIERKLKDGDIILLNRQPTLHLGSMLAMRVRRREGKTIRMNLAITSTFNADFDWISRSKTGNFVLFPNRC